MMSKDAQDRAISTSSKQIFDCVASSGTVYLDFHSAIIYLSAVGISFNMLGHWSED